MAPKIPTSEQKMNAKFPNRVSEANECGLLAIFQTIFTNFQKNPKNFLKQNNFLTSLVVKYTKYEHIL